MTHAEVLARIAHVEGRLASLRRRRDPAALRRAVRHVQAEAEVLERRVKLGLPHDGPPPRWVAVAFALLPLVVIAWVALLARVVR
jgi:hypothetical protein